MNSVFIPTKPIDNVLFPEDQCVEIFKELNSRVSLYKVDCSARIISREPTSEDDPPSRLLLLPTLEDQEYKNCFLQCLFWFSKSFRVPDEKIALAKSFNRKFDPAVFERLGNLIFHPKIDNLSEEEKRTLGVLDSPMSSYFIWRIEDEPEVIELVQTPLRVLLDIISSMYPEVHKVAEFVTQKESGASPRKPNVFHRPYSDSPFAALVEATHFFFNNLSFGPIRASSDWAVENGYRAVNIIAKPPLAMDVIEIHRGFAQKYLEGF